MHVCSFIDHQCETVKILWKCMTHFFTQYHADGVIGCDLPQGGFVEESNFQVKMRIKVPRMEAGWIVKISDVTGEDSEQ